MTQQKKIIGDFFKIDDKIKLNKEDQEYLSELEEALYELLETEGEVGSEKIKEIILDDLLKHEKENIINYLGLTIEEEVNESLERQLKDPDFLKREESDGDNDFFDKLLIDDIVNDLQMSLLGYERKAEGSKETFIKKRGCKIPTERVIAIGDILKTKFNKIEFLSQKDDEEQALIINLTYSLIFDILLEIPYHICNTQKTIEILGMIVIKLTNAIGLSKGFRKELLEALKSSYQSKLDNKADGQKTLAD